MQRGKNHSSENMKTVFSVITEYQNNEIFFIKSAREEWVIAIVKNCFNGILFLIDTSNHGKLKLFAIIVKYFDIMGGDCLKILIKMLLTNNRWKLYQSTSSVL